MESPAHEHGHRGVFWLDCQECLVIDAASMPAPVARQWARTYASVHGRPAAEALWREVRERQNVAADRRMSV